MLTDGQKKDVWNALNKSQRRVLEEAVIFAQSNGLEPLNVGFKVDGRTAKKMLILDLIRHDGSSKFGGRQFRLSERGAEVYSGYGRFQK